MRMTSRARLTHSFNELVAISGALLWFAFVGIWTFGGLVAMVYWIVKEDALNAVLSIVIPVYGLVSMIVDLVR